MTLAFVSFRYLDISSQKASLAQLAKLAERAIRSPEVIYAAREIVSECPARNDECELDAIYEAVKSGNPRIKGLERGVRYVSDPAYFDFFAGPAKVLQHCRAGACAGDCDEHAALVAALAGAIGFQVGIRAWGPGRTGQFTHVFAIVRFPKHGKSGEWLALNAGKWSGLDTTVESASVGWEPPGGHYLDARLEP